MILYKDIRTPSRLRPFIKRPRMTPALLTKGCHRVSDNETATSTSIWRIRFRRKVKVEADLVVLARWFHHKGPQEYLDRLPGRHPGRRRQKAYLIPPEAGIYII
jgi:hypothetical protein